jgi:hypothetical protein
MTTPTRKLAINEIYAQLVRGFGHQHVDDDNVFALIAQAERDGHQILATELREWQAPCSRVETVPSTMAPTRGFNRENVKH